MQLKQPPIKDLAIIGDKRTCALIDKEGTVAWYCPWRFDQPSLFSLLIDKDGGWWGVEAQGKTFVNRQYQGNSAILTSDFSVDGGSFSITDFMPMSSDIHGICRIFSPSPVDITSRLFLTPDYNRSSASLKKGDDGKTVLCKQFEFYIKASHPVTVNHDTIEYTIPAGENGWAVLVEDEKMLASISSESLEQALQQTESKWKQIMNNLSYEGSYKEQMYQSYKAIQLVTHEYSGGILAAGTTSLPEQIGSVRNYDYRFVWLRDTAMVVSALVRADNKGNEAERFLDFLCTARNTNKKNLFVPFYDLDAKTAQDENQIKGTGYKNSRPLRIGNGAFEQLQLDGQGNVLLAAKEIYNKNKEKPHWETIVRTAEYLADHWRKKDHGIWEEHLKEHFTSSKVLAAVSLEFIAEHADNKKQKAKWLNAAKDIRQFIAENCMTADGAYAVYAGSQHVDVTAALYPVWWFDKPDSVAMKQTIKRIEDEYKEGELYHRRLEQSNSKDEGVFLAACLWMAQYYVILKDLKKAKTIIDAVLQFSTDFGFLPEEGDVKTGELLGNIPQTFVHSSLIGVIIDYKRELINEGA
ncbi:MAG: glycoside hydrolase family 15 protein [Segetibacter sp.]|nr:glycoside hydrolase family 15 protein [Segetibacter sp.]